MLVSNIISYVFVLFSFPYSMESRFTHLRLTVAKFGHMWEEVNQSSGVKFHVFFSIVYLTFWVAGRRVYKIQANGDQH